MIGRINKLWNPEGFLVYCYNGDEGRRYQSVFHFHMHVVPIYRKDPGHTWLTARLKRTESGKKEEIRPEIEEYEQTVKNLQIKGGVVAETQKCVAKLASQTQALISGNTHIKSKEFINNDINAVDQETWNQMGELMRESIKKTTEKINSRNFIIHIPLGKMSGPEQEDVKEFVINQIGRAHV